MLNCAVSRNLRVPSLLPILLFTPQSSQKVNFSFNGNLPAARDGPVALSVTLSVFTFNFPKGFKVKSNPLCSNRTGQPFRTFSLHIRAFSKFPVTVFSSFSRSPTLAFRFLFSLSSVEDSWEKMALIFLVASRANISTVKSKSVCED